VSDELDGRLEARARQIMVLLSKPTLRPPGRGLGNPEFRKNLDRLAAAIRDTQRLRREDALTEEQAEALRPMLLEPEDLATLNADSLGSTMETVDQLLVDAADAKLVCSLLEIEYARDAYERGGVVPTWSTLFGEERLGVSADFAAGKEVSDTALEQAQRHLSLLLRARHSLYALKRARETTKAVRLFWLAPLLLALVAVFIAVADWVAEGVSWREPLLVAVAGALGATLAGVFKLRDAIPRLGDLRTFSYTFPLQIPLGAVAALFLWIVLESGIVEVAGGGDDWAVSAALGFVAGFSEPFVLKTIERIAGGASEEPPPAAEEEQPAEDKG
jgi:hypothetical protein